MKQESQESADSKKKGVYMSIELYEKARKMGTKAYKKEVSQGRYPYLPVLDDIVKKEDIVSDVSLGLVDIPLDRVVGTSTSGRTQAFASNFMPLMGEKTEFGTKWSNLCDAHLDEGIRDPIKVYEYLNYYYVVEGNKRVSVLKFFEADSVPAFVTRKVPKLTDDEEIKIYYEFMDFNRKTGVNFIWFSNQGGYSRLMEQVRVSKKYGGELEAKTTMSQISTAEDSADGSGTAIRSVDSKIWSDETILELKAAYRRFATAFKKRGGDELKKMTTGDAFIVFIELKSFDAVCEMGIEEIEKEITAMWQEFLVVNEEYSVDVSLDPPDDSKKNLFEQLAASFNPAYSESKPLKIAFLYGSDPNQSDWIYSHELGRNHIKEVFGDKVVTLKITTSSSEDELMAAMEDLIETQHVEVIFTTTTTMVSASLKCAIKYPDVKILNCSLNTSHRYIRTYYARLFEAKFLSGMVAGALTETNKIGYIADYPIVGITANINAFAIGAKMVNPAAKVYLKWSTVKENRNENDIYKAFEKEGIDFISDKEMIIPNKASRKFGLYKLKDGEPVSFTMTAYNWGVMYERIVNIIMNGKWNSTDNRDESKPINYWWGFSAGVIDIIFSDKVPSETKKLVDVFKSLVTEDKFSAFQGEIYSQGGKLRVENGQRLDTDEIMMMNWLVDNIVGDIPDIDELSEKAKPIVEMRGIRKEEKEDEDTCDS